VTRDKLGNIFLTSSSGAPFDDQATQAELHSGFLVPIVPLDQSITAIVYLYFCDSVFCDSVTINLTRASIFNIPQGFAHKPAMSGMLFGVRYLVKSTSPTVYNDGLNLLWYVAPKAGRWQSISPCKASSKPGGVPVMV
jgi:hypothetical protein